MWPARFFALNLITLAFLLTNGMVTSVLAEGYLIPQVRNKRNNDEGPTKEAMVTWLQGHTSKIGNTSDIDMKSIVNSIYAMTRPESPRFPRIRIFNYNFKSGKSREILLYNDPDEERQWIVNIEDLDLRRHLIAFRLGDLGFGFAKENTFVVLRKSLLSKTDHFHYLHLVYLRERAPGSSAKLVEWDNVKPKDLLPFPIIFNEDKDQHLEHCVARKCGLIEHIFGTCPIARLNCDSLKDLPLKDSSSYRERLEALLRERQPFIFELARSLSINRQYMKQNIGNSEETSSGTGSRKKRAVGYIKLKRVKKDEGRVHNVNATNSTESNSAESNSTEPNTPKPHAPPASQPNGTSRAVTAQDTETILKSVSPLDLVLMKSDNSAAAANLDIATEVLAQSLPFGDENDTKSYFESVMDKIQNGPPAKYSVRPFECVGCEPMGTFFSDYQQNPLLTYVANKIVANLFSNASVRATVFSPEANEVMDAHPNVPFIGYGGCDYSIDVLSNPPKSTELDDLIDFYSESLAVNCRKHDCEFQMSKTRMRELLTSKHHLLEVWPDLTIRFNKTSKLAKNLIISTNEFRQLMVSLILSVYTVEYRVYQNRKHADIMERHTYRNQSLRMNFQSRVIFRALDELTKNFPHHLVKGCRYLLQILQDKYLSLVAEHMRISEFDFQEPERTTYQRANRDDRFQIIAITDFIVNGISPTSLSGIGSMSAFNSFLHQNRKRLQHLLVDLGFKVESNGKHSQRRHAELAEVDQLFKSIMEHNNPPQTDF